MRAEKTFVSLAVVAILISAAFFLIFSGTFLLKALKIPEGSVNMEDALLPNDHFYIVKSAYGFNLPMTKFRIYEGRKPACDDIVAFISPKDGKPRVSRIVACPGDLIQMKSKKLYRNGGFVKDT